MYTFFGSFVSFLLVCTTLPRLTSAHNTSPLTLYVADQSRGILKVRFDPSKPASSSLDILDVNTNAGFMPGWLTAHNDNIYSVSRTFYPNNASTDGGVFAFRNRGSGRRLQLLNSKTSGGVGAVACDVSPDGRTIGVASIDGSTVSIHPLTSAGMVGNASYTFRYNLATPGPGTNDSQEISNPHQAIFEPYGQYLFVPDRGADRLYAYRVGGPYDVELVNTVVLPPGTGPRHLTFRVFNETRTYLYLVSELDNTLRLFTIDGLCNRPYAKPAKSSNIIITERQVASTLSPGSVRTNPNNTFLAAEVALSNDGRFAYVSNRDTTSLKPDNIALFAVSKDHSQEAHHLFYLGTNSTYGKIPRHFSLSKDIASTYVAVANEVTQSLIVMKRDPRSGFMSKVVGSLSLGSLDITQKMGPVAVIWD